MALESKFKSDLIKELEYMFPGAIILKNDANSLPGIPDTLILYKYMWATLEAKKREDEPHRPNQDYYVDLLNRMSYSAFIYPENKERILNELQSTFGFSRATRLPRSIKISLDKLRRG